MTKKNKITDFKTQVANPNRHNTFGMRLLEESIQKDGWLGAQTSAADGEIIAGSARQEIAVEKFTDKNGVEVEPIVIETDGSRPVIIRRTDIANANTARARRLSAAENQIARSNYNPDFALLKEWADEDVQIKKLFSEDEWREGTGEEPEIVDAEPQIDSDRFEEVAKKWKTANGQLWMVGRHYIFCGNSLDASSIEIVLQGQEPALIEADPPYGINIVAANVSVGGGENSKGMIPFGGRKGNVGGGASHIAKTGMTYMESNKRLRGTDGSSKPFGSKAVRGSVGAAHVVEVGKYPVIIGDESTDTAKKAVALYLERFDNAYHVWWGANYYIESLKPSSCWLVWNKETTGHFADCELAWSNADMSAKLFTHRWNGMLRDSEREKRWHPTQKPAALAEWSYGLFTSEDDVILDPFGGAGWTLLAAQRTNRKACVIEKLHQYTAVMLERMATAFPGIEIKRIE